MLRRRIRALLTILELVYHATTGKGIHDASQINNTLGRTVYDEAQTPSLSETVTEPLNESRLSAFLIQSLSSLQVDCSSTTTDYVLNMTYLSDLDNLKTRDTLGTSALCFSGPQGPVDSLKGLAHLTDNTSGKFKCPMSMDSTSLDTLGTLCATHDPTPDTILGDPTNYKDAAIGKQFANSSIADLRLVNLFLYLYCLNFGRLVVAIRQRGLETSRVNSASLRKVKDKGHYFNAFLSGVLGTMEFIGSLIILTIFGRPMLLKIQLKKAGRICNLLWDVLYRNLIQQRIMLVDDSGFDNSPSYADELENYSDSSLPGAQDQSSQSLSAPPSELYGFVTAMSIMSTPKFSILSRQPSARSTSSEHAYQSSVSTFEGTPPLCVNVTLPELKSLALPDASHDTSYIDVNEVMATAAPPFEEGSIRTSDSLDENLFTGETSRIFLTRLPCSDYSRKFVFRHTVPSMSSGDEPSLASELSPSITDTPCYVAPGELDFATTKSPLRLVPSCPSSPTVLHVSIRSPPAVSPYSRLRAEFNELLNPNEPQYLSPHPLAPLNRQSEGFTPEQLSAAPAIGPFDGAKPVNSLPQFLFTSPISVSSPSGQSDSPGLSPLPGNVPGPIRSKSSTFFVNTCVKHSDRLVSEPTVAQAHKNSFVLKTRRDLSSYGLMARNPPFVHSPTSSATETPNPAPRRQGSLLENKFTLPQFHLNL